MKSLLAAAAVIALLAPAVAHADPAADALARYVAWRGGAPFASAQGLAVRGTMDNGRYQGTLERRIEPGRLAEHIAVGSADMRRALIGEGGWTVTFSGQVEDAGEVAAQEAARRRLAAFDDAFDGAHGAVTLAPDETFDGKRVQVLRVAFTTGGAYELLLDRASGALLADRSTEEGVPTTTRYADWRMVEGVRMAFRQVQTTEGEPLTLTTTLTSVEIDPAADASAFARPDSRRIYSFPQGRAATAPLGFELFLGNRIVIPAQVNGVATPVMLDSGAEVTVLDKAYAEKLGIKPDGLVAALGTGGRDVAELASGVTLQLGEVELKGVTVAIMDLSPIAAGIGRPLPAILGKEVLNVLTVQLDFAGKTITFHDPASYQPPAGAVAVPVSNVGGLHAIPVSIEGAAPVLMHFDLGNGSPMLVYPNYWKPQAMLTGRPVSKILSGGVGAGGPRTRSIATVRTISLGGIEVRDVPAVFGDEDNSVFNIGHTSGNVGMPVLSRFGLTTDYARNRLLLTPRADALAAPFVKDRAGALVRPADGGLTIALVAPGSPAEAAGLKPGQLITAVDGRPAVELGVAGYSALRTAKAGSVMTLTLQDGAQAPLTLKDYY
ncbi:MAG: hypothetical protein C0481_02075 [Phenylobacterium sp.]|uniref:aspartyl protease family protein n=1 Tax=Phenylobacterium sp. TaxID=1871053 RepID=UPI0025DAC28D|nr:aspartyl protease family protein [Phenylobacterium sp.]MBA4010632.1 hypothetical protein [Phenylobacterium sp.]